ncbi:MAG TPA: class I SAM-dependent methyltransferase [Vicinamibacterales bacterium]|nr:class I SAM-dependent methyltransferase [Vicinamibacterales bacterium]
MTAVGFTPIDACWICGGRQLQPYHTLRFELDVYRHDDQDHDLAEYSGATLRLVRCAACGFGQPEALPALPRYFDRMYDQRWDEAWIANEFHTGYKDLIFRSILRELERRVGRSGRRLLDVGAHAGRFLRFAVDAGWNAEGVELNPKTAAYAAAHSGARVHQINAASLAADGRRYDAIVLTDVLEHIPAPLDILSTLTSMLDVNGVLAIKVPSGSAQAMKERALAALTSHRATLADNLVHVNHFSPGSLALALERAGLSSTVRTAPPELAPSRPLSARAALLNAVRLGIYGIAQLPGAIQTPLALHLQAYGVRRAA